MLFWGANPIHSAPRHVVRYAVFARGRFTERGIEDRQAAAVDIYQTELARFCPLFIKINPGQELDLVAGAAAILAGEPPPDPVVRGTRRLAKFLAQAACGVIFCGRGVSYGPALELFDRLARLVAMPESPGAVVSSFPCPATSTPAGCTTCCSMRRAGPGRRISGRGRW